MVPVSEVLDFLVLDIVQWQLRQCETAQDAIEQGQRLQAELLPETSPLRSIDLSDSFLDAWEGSQTSDAIEIS